jgi:hypothetical protein
VFERFTDRARRVVVLSQEEARLLNHNYIGTEHILLGLIREHDGFAALTLQSLGISLDDARVQVAEIIGRGGQAPSGHIPFTPRAKKVLELSLREALQLGHNYIGTEHILLGLIREGEGVAAQVLQNLGADLIRARARVIELLGSPLGTARAKAESAVSRRGIVPAACSFCGIESPACGALFISLTGATGALICEHCLASGATYVIGSMPEAPAPADEPSAQDPQDDTGGGDDPPETSSTETS